MIHPTIGRVVLVTRIVNGSRLSPQAEPALVAYVHSDRMINVGGFDANGFPFQATSVTLLQDDDPAPVYITGTYAEWMPYQKAQAEKMPGETD